MIKQNEYDNKMYRNKDKDFRDNYLKSFIHKSKFESRTLNKFKNHTMILNSNNMSIKNKCKTIVMMEKLKHEQNKRASEKRGFPDFDLDMAQKLLEGKFHEGEDDFDDECSGMHVCEVDM